ncbi:hypothetical protein MKK84_18700 [Methylobacterium sp. E-065]|uniref:hypothetical protein n=1 Tax=Methylobacterium sp. E-065 TaxID=2836583 RepID=UPI001FBBB2B4|nr:hypothetical protein [Methylobacterium sp. E-065]MCJ2019441.1 hypothetical protein [Methylobacterium sp. E-065]
MADYTCKKCGTPHETRYENPKTGNENHDIRCLNCKSLMGTEKVFGVFLRVHMEGEKPGTWERVPAN